MEGELEQGKVGGRKEGRKEERLDWKALSISFKNLGL